MPNLKFSQFLEQTDPANVQFVVGYNGTDNVRIAPGDLGGGYPFLIDTQSLYSGFVPAGLSGNPQGNTVLGISAGNSLTTSIDNTLIGDSAGKSITNNTLQNVMVGSHAGEFKSVGSQSVLIGYQAGQNSSGGGTVLIGLQAGRFTTAGNTIAIGDNAARSNQSATHLSIGSTAGYSNTTGSGNTNIGHLTGGLLTTGSNNTNLGYRAGSDVTGNNNVLLGFQAGTSSGAWNNTIIIGHNGATSPIGASNFIVLGNSSHTTLQIPGIQSGATDGDVLTYNATFGKLELAAAGGGGASDLNGLSDCLVDGTSLYVGEVPSSLSGNPIRNTILGIDAGNALTTGTGNTLIGNGAGLNITSMNSTTAVGYEAGKSQNAESNNTYIGRLAGRDHIGAQSVFLGAQNRVYNNGKNSNGVTAIGYSAHDVSAGNFSTAVGYVAGNAATGDSGTYVGRSAGRVNTSSSHVSVGHNAGYSQTSGIQNTNFGYSAGYSNTTGTSRVMVGYEAGLNNTGNNNVFLGKATGKGAGSGSQTIAIGQGVMESGSAANNSVFIGNYMAANTTSGADSTVAIGTNCLSVSGYSGEANTVVGHQAGNNLSSGDNNTLIGRSAGDSITTGSNLTVIGYEADASSATATNEITLGNASVTSFRIPGIQSGASDGDVLTFNSSAGKLELQAAGGGGASDLNGLSDVTANSSDSLLLMSTTISGYLTPETSVMIGYGNAGTATGSATYLNDTVIVGTNNFQNNQRFNNQICIGENNGNNGWDQSSNNILIGNGIGSIYGGGYNTYSNYNILLGRSTFSRKAGSENVAIGRNVMSDNGKNVLNNIAIGSYSMRVSSQAIHNTCVGDSSGRRITSGDNNTFIGSQTGYDSTNGTTTGSNNTLLGYGANASSNSVSNEITLGDSNITSLRCAVTSITSLSDERDKSEIKDLEYGLTFIDALQPREFVWDNRPETRTVVSLDENSVPLEDENGEQITETQEFYSSNKGKKDFGFIAQEVRELDNDTLRLVYTENEEKLELSYGKLVPILVKAIQELKEEVEILKSQNN